MDYSPARGPDSASTDLTNVITHENITAMIPLRAIRAGKGVSLRGLKALSGVAVATLARIEAGGYDPRLSTLKRIAKALEVTVAVLIGEQSHTKGGSRYGADETTR